MCVVEITDAFLDAQTRLEMGEQNVVHKIELDSGRDCYLKAAEKREDEWAKKV